MGYLVSIKMMMNSDKNGYDFNFLKKKWAAFTKYPVLLFCRACNHVKIFEIGVSKVAKYSLKLFSAICFNCVCHILYV